MRDLFDEFMEELRRRQAGLERGERGETPDSPTGGDAADTQPGTKDAQRAGPGDADDEGPAMTKGRSGADATPEPPDEEPERIRPVGGGRRGGPPPRRTSRRGGPGGPRDGGPQGLGMGRAPLVVGLIVVVFIVVSLAGVLLDLATDAIWYRSVGYDGVFWTRIGAQAALFVVGLVVALVVLLADIWIAGRLSPQGGAGPGLQGFLDRLMGAPAESRGRPWTLGPDRYDPRGPHDESGFPRGPFGGFGGPGFGGSPGRGGGGFAAAELPELPDLTALARWILVVIAFLAALSLAGGLAGAWETILLWLHQVPFAPAAGEPAQDPIFGRDIGFYLFQLPFLRLGQTYFNYLVLAALLLAIARYVVAVLSSGTGLPTSARVHLAILGGLYLLSVAGGYQLDKLELVYHQGAIGGIATGVSYTDQHARFVALDVMTVIAAFAAAFLVGGAFTRLNWPLGVVVVSWFVASFLLGQVYPGLVQTLTVVPNQQAQETPYIQANIAMSRLAYGLDRWDDKHSYTGTGSLTQAAIQQDQATFQNARLWDYRPLAKTLDQLQAVRNYYTFDDVDTDRYTVNGTVRQVMLAARELSPDQLAAQAGGALSWVNQHITYTHGIGLAMVPVNEVTSEGQPNFFVRDLPPVSTAGAPTISQPRIYFGTTPSDYVIVGARQAEFDFPLGGSDQASTQGTSTSWKGTTGIRLDSTLSRLLFALRFRDLNLLISDQVTADSQLLFHRTLQDRLQRIAPFLRYDKDPYLVVTGAGRLVYIQDAYTISDRFPDAEPFDGSTLGSNSGLAGDSFDYIRNSVKVVMDAYDGTMTFYVADPSDPIVRAYEGVFPSLFKPLSQMPADLQAHLRYPEELFNVQVQQYAAYHVTDAGVFYSKNDLWTVPPNVVQSQNGQLPLEAYYVEMRMPGEPSAEFLLLQPMTPKDRQNMIAWLAARNDGPQRGEVRVFRFPADTTILGPQQIEARIDQDPVISAQLTLWGQIGSQVVRGNLIVVPVQDSLLYLEPIYLQSTTTNLPEFKKIVVASPSRVVWGDTLAQALDALLTGGPAPSPSPSGSPSPSPSGGPSPTPAGTPPPGNVQALVDYANRHFELAQQALRDGDFARYGQEIAIVQATLRQLQGVVGTPAPSASVPASPAASASPSP
ncbi:MAG TPA: UPF0182 family protein [Candidatus Limnocylindrales bacterium]